MTYGAIVDMIEEMGLPFAYDHFAEGESPSPPFIVFLMSRSDNFGADDKVYQKINELHIELYTDKKDPTSEALVETVLDRYEIYWEKYEEYIAEEKLYEVDYTMEVIQS